MFYWGIRRRKHASTKKRRKATILNTIGSRCFASTAVIFNFIRICFSGCGPPPRVGRVTFQPVKKAYNVGETVTYSCVATYASNQTATKSTCSMIDFQPYWDLKDLPECVSGRICQTYAQ